MRGKLGRSGIEEFPLKLVIITIIIAITVPLVTDALADYSKDQMELEIRSEMKRLITVVKLSYSSGIGTSIPMTIEIDEVFLQSLDYLYIGDEPGGRYGSVIRFRIEGGAKMIMLIDPPVPVVGPHSNGPVHLSEGVHKLRVTHISIEDQEYIRISFDS